MVSLSPSAWLGLGVGRGSRVRLGSIRSAAEPASRLWVSASSLEVFGVDTLGLHLLGAVFAGVVVLGGGGRAAIVTLFELALALAGAGADGGAGLAVAGGKRGARSAEGAGLGVYGVFGACEADGVSAFAVHGWPPAPARGGD